jgi:putative phosphoribosyl transferase
MEFFSREDAGQRLGQLLCKGDVEFDIVLGLPRGGVVVAAQVAVALDVPLDVVVVRKIGHPRHREFAVGALAEGDVVVLDHLAINKTGVVMEELGQVIDEERQRLKDYQSLFEHGPPIDLASKSVLVVDDGLATGATTEAAVQLAQRRGARKVFLAVPVASDNGYERLNRACDGVFALMVDPDFNAVGRYYREFSQTTDAEVIELLEKHRKRWANSP